MKTVYTCFCTDIIHDGHRNILREAAKLGRVVVGVLSDPEMLRYNRFPTRTLAERMEMLRAEELVDEVVVQEHIFYDEILAELRPDYVIHGRNWAQGPESALRKNVLACLKRLGGELVEPPYTYNEEVVEIDRRMREHLAMPERRRGRLRRLLEIIPIVKTIEVHNGLTGLIAEKTVVESDGGLDQFDAMWISSLCDSTARGKPDIELVDFSDRIQTINEVMDVTTKP
ncbi:MAG: adenylyltransferase/cytidyltransferase family protein, partial [Selenomonas artemidis]